MSARLKGGPTPPFNMRLPLDLRRDLEAAASKSGKPLTREIISRLQRSLYDDRDIEKTFGDEKTYRLIQAISVAIQEARLRIGTQDWTNNQKNFDFVVSTINKILDKIRPGGSIYVSGYDKNSNVPEPVQQLMADAKMQAAHSNIGSGSYFAAQEISDDVWSDIRDATNPTARLARIRESLADVLNRPGLVDAEFWRRCSRKERKLLDETGVQFGDDSYHDIVIEIRKQTISEMQDEGIDTSSLKQWCQDGKGS